tara:strand:+ start:7198 stop:15990 length:8793 start_codon:yes stop_codon:yes gene_type:complete
MRKLTILAGISLSAISLMTIANAAPDWMQKSVKGQDISVSHDGQQWFVGQDGRAYKWNAQTTQWDAKGSRSDLKHIDAGKDGVAAITNSGTVYISNNQGHWRSTSIRAKDVGIGGGKIWLAGAQNKTAGRVTLFGDFNASGDIDWNAVNGSLIRVDVDPQGRPWGVDADGAVFVYADGKWIGDDKAPKASDIGVGGDGSIFIVGRDIEESLGGGRVYQRNPNTGDWSAVPGRLSAVSVTPDGKAFGVNSLNWVMAGNAAAVKSTQSEIELEAGELAEFPNDTSVIAQNTLTLADIIGTAVPGASKVLLKQVEITENTITGTAEFDGAPVRATLFQPNPKETLVIAALEHASVDLGTYVSKIRESNLGSFGLANAIFFMQDEDAAAITYDDFASMPKPLSSILGKGDQEGLFPLTIHPGVSVIGTYAPADNNAGAVMAAYGIPKTGYVVKGHFKLSQLKNVSFSEWDASSLLSKKDSATRKKELCEATAKAGLSGLDINFPIPQYAPAFAKGVVNFEQTTFSLKEIDGQLEPAIVSGMTINLKKADAGQEIGLNALSMAGKVSVQTDMNAVCNGLNTESQGIIAISGATAFDAADVKDISFAALARVTDSGVKTQKINTNIGWKHPFGLPFLNIRQYAFTGTFEQSEQDGKLQRTLNSTVWMNSQLDRAEFDLSGSIKFSINDTEQTLNTEDWSFESKGPIAINDLPGLKDMPKIDEFVLGDISLSPTQMTGTLEWPSEKLKGDAFFAIDNKESAPSEFNLFVRFNTVTPNLLTNKLPPIIRDVNFAPAIIGWGNKATSDMTISAMPEDLQLLFDGLLDKDNNLIVAKGLTIVGKTQPQNLLGSSLNRFTDLVTIDGGITMKGALEANPTGDLTGTITAALDGIKIHKIPETTVVFENAELTLSNLDGDVIEIETDAKVSVPDKTDPLDMKGIIKYTQRSDANTELAVKLSSDQTWNNPLKIPDLQMTNLGVAGTFTQDGNKTSEELGYFGTGIFRKQSGTVSVSLAASNGAIENAVVSFESTGDGFNIAEFLTLPAGAENIANAKIKTLLLSKNAVAADMAFNLNKLAFDGRGAIITDDGGNAALFLRQDKALNIADLVENIPAPLDALTIPEGVLIISSKAVPSFDAGRIPDAIYDDVLGDMVDDDLAYSLLVEDGLTFLTKMNVSQIPSPASDLMKTPFGIKDEVFLAGSVGGLFGGAPSLGFYTILKNVTPTLPDFVKEFVEFKDANIKLFVRHKKGDNNTLEVGLGSDAKIKARRLDDPSVVQPLDGTFEVKYSAGGSGIEVGGSASINGVWNDPLGLEGYSLKDTTISFGQEEKGTTLGIHTDRAEFQDGGQKKAFILDLDTTWAGAVPTDLAVQFSKTKDTAELILTPVTMARLQKSIFDLVFRSGSKIKDALLKGLEKAPTANDPILVEIKKNAPTVINSFTNLVEKSSDGAFSLVEKSPLSMIGVKNPYIYFGTPGSTPPSNPEVERPPLGFGLAAKGDFMIDIGALKANLASGEYKVNLKDGYAVHGSVTPPAPFASNTISVDGNMPFLGGPQYLRFAGSLDLPIDLIPSILPAKIDGTFDVSRGSLAEPKASISSDINIGGRIHREASMNLNGTSLTFDSPGSCFDVEDLGFDVPIDFAGTLNLADPQSLPTALVASVRPSTDPLACIVDLGKALGKIASGTYETGKAIVTDPVGSAEAAIEAGTDVLTDPNAAFDAAKNVGKTPLKTGEALAGAGINLVKLGVEQVPVLGPGAGMVIGTTFDKANELKDFAMGQIANNAVTGWMSDSIGAGLGAVGGAVGDAIGAVGGLLKKKKKAPIWYRVNPPRCKHNMHHWNDVFKQCFESGAVVLFDETNRGNDKIGDCIRVHHTYYWDPVRVDKCFGDSTNQFHLDPATDQIKTANYAYNGWNGGWNGPFGEKCLTRRAESQTLPNGAILYKDEIYQASCHIGGDNAKWTYTADMKLKNGEECITRDATNKLMMGDCASANQWLGTSVVPNWNEVEKVPTRGKIASAALNHCLYWARPSGPWTLVDCAQQDESEEDKFLGRTLTYLRVLDGQHTIEMMGSRFWDGQMIYGCMGAKNGDDTKSNINHCTPDRYYDDNKWTVFAVAPNGGLDTSNNIPLNDILQSHDYVFRNVHNNKCLYVDVAKANETIAANRDPLPEWMSDCTDWRGNVKNGAKFRGYAADAVGQQALLDAAAKQQKEWAASRDKIRENLTTWQRYRIRAENARIDNVLKMSSTINGGLKATRLRRTSPGQCHHNEFWNQNLKRCTKGNRMLLMYNGSAGNPKGCLRNSTDYYGAKIMSNCDLTGDHEAVLNEIGFFFDEEGHIIKKNAEYQLNVQPIKDADGNIMTGENGQTLYRDAGDIEIEKNDSCLTMDTSVNRLNGLMPLAFITCNERSETWRYTPTGELVSSNGMCVRESLQEQRKSNISHSEAIRRTKEYTDVYNTKIRALKAQRAAKGDGWYIPLAQAAVYEYRAAEKQLKDDMRNDYTIIEIPYFVLDDCKKDPMQTGKRRWLPSIGYDFSKEQLLPKTATLTTAANDNLCITGDMQINGSLTLETCASGNKNQYFAFGGVDRTRFMISPRNSKTCLYDAGNNTISHRPCTTSAAELFMKIDTENGTLNIQNALSGQCIAIDGGVAAAGVDIIQTECSSASAFKFNTVESIEGITFAGVADLQPNETRTATAQAIWDKQQEREKYLYMGTYLRHGNVMLQKGDNDVAIMMPQSQNVELSKQPSHISVKTNTAVYIPPITVPKTSIMMLPGFADGSDHVTFVHAKPVEFNDGKPARDNVADPYAGNFADWFIWVHYQKALHVTPDGLKFDYLDETTEFQNSATFKMVPARSGDTGKYSFESIAQPGQYLQNVNGQLTLGTNAAAASFTVESTAQWFMTTNLSKRMAIEDPRHDASIEAQLRDLSFKAKAENWKFPDTPQSVLNKNY